MVEILVVRHGQSEADIMNRCEGRADFALTDLGQRRHGSWQSGFIVNILWMPFSPVR